MSYYERPDLPAGRCEVCHEDSCKCEWCDCGERKVEADTPAYTAIRLECPACDRRVRKAA